MTEVELKKLSSEHLIKSLENHFEQERKTSHTILLHLSEMRRRRLYLERGFSSLFEMLARHFKISETSAYQRLKALELMQAVPEVEEKLKSWEVNLSTLCAGAKGNPQGRKSVGAKIRIGKEA